MVRNALERSCRAATVKDSHFHDFRHYCVTTGRKRNVPAAIVMLAMGWRSPKMLLHHTNLKDRDVGEAFGTATVLPLERRLNKAGKGGRKSR
jgi:integrase